MRFGPRFFAALIALVACATVWSSAVQATPADTVGLPFVNSIHTIPTRPCAEVPTRIVVKGAFPTSCGRLLGHDGFTVNLMDPFPNCAECLATPPPPGGYPWADTLDVGWLNAGNHEVRLRVNVIDSTCTVPETTVHDTLFAFAVGSTCASDFVESIRVFGRTTGVPCPGDSLLVQIEGVFPNDCYRLRSISWLPKITLDIGPPPLRVVIDDGCCLGRVCLEQPRRWLGRVTLPPLPAGSYYLSTEVGVVCCADSFLPMTQPDRLSTRFRVLPADSCPPPPTDPLRYVDFVRVSPAQDTTTAILCPDDSVKVTVGGSFPDQCKRLRRIDLFQDPSPAPRPPVMRLVFDNLCCADMACPPTPRPWQAHVVFPPLPAGNYSQVVQAVEVCCTDSVRPEDPIYTRVAPFTVVSAESCSIAPPDRCLIPGWDHSGRVGPCDAFLGGGAAALELQLRTTVPLAGLQGRVAAIPEDGFPSKGIGVMSIEPVGPAQGMRLTWVREEGGARFVLFNERGAPIPATGRDGPPVSVLRITWEPGVWPAYGPVPDRWFVRYGDVLGADEFGNGVPLCPIRAGEALPDIAVICAGRGPCDLNGDATADVRDLVLMARCLTGAGACPPDPAALLDCQGDHDFDLDDVICCARTVLGSPPCPACGDSTRAEPTIAFSFGTPVRTAGGWDIPISIDDVPRIGAARMTFRMPNGMAAGASLTVQDPRFLPIEQRTDGRLLFGLIRIPGACPSCGPRPAAANQLPPSLTGTLHVPAEGSDPAGRITLEDVEMSGPDGVRLAVDLGGPVVRIGPGVSLALSQPRPNPFRSSTTFRLTLDAPADVDVGVYDLAGRRLVTLAHGALPVGMHGLTWNGRGAGGGQVPAGVYFVRATAPGNAVVQRLILVRD